MTRTRSARCRITACGRRLWWGGVPDGWQVSGQGPDLVALGGGQRPGAGGGEPVVLLAQPLPLGEGGLPVLFQLPGDQAVLRLDQLVLAAALLGLVISAFQALPPDQVDVLALGFGLPGRGQRHLKHRHRPPPTPVPAPTSPSRRASATNTSRPSIPRTGDPRHLIRLCLQSASSLQGLRSDGIWQLSRKTDRQDQPRSKCPRFQGNPGDVIRHAWYSVFRNVRCLDRCAFGAVVRGGGLAGGKDGVAHS